MSARTKPLVVIEAVDMKIYSEVISYETPAPRGQVKLVSPGDEAKLVELLHAEAKVI
jgi:electron transfer flavoprotein beta subunit